MQTQAAIDAGVLSALPQLMRHPKSSVQKEAAWAVSNIAAGPCQQIQQLITCGLLAPLVDLLRNVCRNGCFSGMLNVFCPRGVAYKMFLLEFDGLLLKLGINEANYTNRPSWGFLKCCISSIV